LQRALLLVHYTLDYFWAPRRLRPRRLLVSGGLLQLLVLLLLTLDDINDELVLFHSAWSDQVRSSSDVRFNLEKRLLELSIVYLHVTLDFVLSHDLLKQINIVENRCLQVSFWEIHDSLNNCLGLRKKALRFFVILEVHKCLASKLVRYR
jgi:hypothetical protein